MCILCNPFCQYHQLKINFSSYLFKLFLKLFIRKLWGPIIVYSRLYYPEISFLQEVQRVAREVKNRCQLSLFLAYYLFTQNKSRLLYPRNFAWVSGQGHSSYAEVRIRTQTAYVAPKSMYVLSLSLWLLLSEVMKSFRWKASISYCGGPWRLGCPGLWELWVTVEATWK